MPLKDPNTLPYRPCAGIVLLNAEGLIWVGRLDELVQQETESAGRCRRAVSTSTKIPEAAALRRALRGDRRSQRGDPRRIEGLDSLRPSARGCRHRAAKENIADNARNGSQCDLPATSARSIFSPLATNRNSMRGAGQRRKRGSRTGRRRSSAPPMKPCWRSLHTSRLMKHKATFKIRKTPAPGCNAISGYARSPPGISRTAIRTFEA